MGCAPSTYANLGEFQLDPKEIEKLENSSEPGEFTKTGIVPILESSEASEQNTNSVVFPGEAGLTVRVKSQTEDKTLSIKNKRKRVDASIRFEDVYKMGKLIGQGAFSKVRRAVHKETGKEFAVKVIHLPSLPSEDESRGPMSREHLEALHMRETIFTEISILEDLEHPNVLFLNEYFVEEDEVYIVTNISNGGELFDTVTEVGDQYGWWTIEEEDARTIFRQILEGLNYLHQRNIAHRDLKLENLLLAHKNDFSSVLIADFGLAVKFDKTSCMDTICGSPMYLAPEVIQSVDGVGYTCAADCWSAGIILYMLLCGESPFDASSEPKLLNSIKRGKFDFGSPVWLAVSKEAKDLVHKLLNVDVRKRYTAEKALKHKWIANAAPLTC